jgi:hypothetical protein
MTMRLFELTVGTMVLGAASVMSLAQEMKYPPLSAYLMARDAEVALARSAAPESISGRATIKVLTRSGFEVAQAGDNGFVCLVMRGFTGAPTFTPVEFRALSYDPSTLAPICLNPQAVRTVLPYYELRTRLGIEGKTPEQMAVSVQRAYDKGEIPKRDVVGFGYMWSADQKLGPAGHWHPHLMIYAPNYANEMLGGNPAGSHLPAVSDDSGTPFAVVVVPVDEKLAIRAQVNTGP